MATFPLWTLCFLLNLGTMMKLAYLISLCGMVAISNALTIGQFQNLTTCIWDGLNNTDPSDRGQLSLAAANGIVWLVSRPTWGREYSHDEPWDPTSPHGGIVSRLNTTTDVCIRTAYAPFPWVENRYPDTLFILGDLLFMLTYDGTTGNNVGYRKLFFWSDDMFAWSEIPLVIDPPSVINSVFSLHGRLSVAVPDQSGSVAYFAAASHRRATRGTSHMMFDKLEVNFTDAIPSKATMKPVARVDHQSEPNTVVFIAKKGDLLYAFVDTLSSEGTFRSVTDFLYTMDLRNGQLSNVSLTGPAPPMYFYGMFQVENEVLLFDSAKVYGTRSVKDIWSLNLGTLEWMSTNMTSPADARDFAAYDQQGANLYLAGLKGGVFVASVAHG